MRIFVVYKISTGDPVTAMIFLYLIFTPHKNKNFFLQTENISLVRNTYQSAALEVIIIFTETARPVNGKPALNRRRLRY